MAVRRHLTKPRSVGCFAGTSLVLALALAGCGGGGSSSSSPTPPTAAESSVTIKGEAIKGPLAKARISLYKTNAQGTQGDLLTTTDSADDGTYSATVTGYTGVVLVVATVVPGKTTMYDEATKTTIIPSSDFTLRASVTANDGDKLTVSVNPFTELSTVNALASSGGLTSANVDAANKATATKLTFNPLTTVATYDADKKPTNNLAVALTAVSKMADSGDISTCTGGDQAAKVACVTQSISTKGLNDAAVLKPLQNQINTVASSNAQPVLTIVDEAKPGASTPSTPGTTTPTTPTLTPVQQAKAMISTLRSNVKALSATDNSLNADLQAVADEFKGKTLPLAGANLQALDLARKGAQFYKDIIQTPGATFVPGKSFYQGYQSKGGCSFYSDTAYTVVATSKADALYVACGTAGDTVPAVDANGESKNCAAVGELCFSSWSIRVRLHPVATDSNKFTMYTQTRESKQLAKTFAYSYRIPGEVVSHVDDAYFCPGYDAVNCVSTVKYNYSIQVSQAKTNQSSCPIFSGISNCQSSQGVSYSVPVTNHVTAMSPSMMLPDPATFCSRPDVRNCTSFIDLPTGSTMYSYDIAGTNWVGAASCPSGQTCNPATLYSYDELTWTYGNIGTSCPSGASSCMATTRWSYDTTTPLQYVSNATSCPANALNCSSYAAATTESRTQYGDAFPGNAAVLSIQSDKTNKTGTVGLVGSLSPAYSLGGRNSYYDPSRAMWVYKQNVATLLGDKQNVSLNGDWSEVNGLDRVNVAGSMELIKGGVSNSKLELLAGSYMQTRLSSSTATQKTAQDGSEEMLLKLKGGTTGSAVEIDAKLANFAWDVSHAKYIPTVVTLTGSIQRNGVNFFEGSILVEDLNHASFNSSKPRSASNELIQRMSFNGKITIPTRPILSLVLSATEHDKGSKTLSTMALTGQYAQGDMVINLTGAGTLAANTITMESTDGVKLVIDGTKQVWPLTKSGQEVGSVSRPDSKVTYTDGTYEQF